jgi:hypothetical protein
MSVRPPQILHKPKDDEDPLSQALQNEILNEKAATLFRLQKRLETALRKLDAARADAESTEETISPHLAEACEALWYVSIQREMCGLRNSRAYYDELRVPHDVRLHMGPNIRKGS